MAHSLVSSAAPAAALFSDSFALEILGISSIRLPWRAGTAVRFF